MPGRLDSVGRPVARDDPRAVAVGQQRRPHDPGPGPEPLPPRLSRLRLPPGRQRLVQDRGRQQVQQLALVPDVPVQRGRADAEPPRQLPEGEAVQPGLIEQVQRRRDDLSPGDRHGRRLRFL
jgi:hypothetical protein